MVKVSFGRPCHVPPCLINEEGGSTRHQMLILQYFYNFISIKPKHKTLGRFKDFCFDLLAVINLE